MPDSLTLITGLEVEFKPKLSSLFSQGAEFLHCVEKANGRSSCCKGGCFPHVLTCGVVCRESSCGSFFFRFLTHLKEGNLHVSISFAIAVDYIFLETLNC